MYLVKTSPSKKRRAVTHGPLKKAGGAGPSLLVTTSSNNQHPALQHQVSSEAKEDSEGDNCKNWKYENEFFLMLETGYVYSYRQRFNLPACVDM